MTGAELDAMIGTEDINAWHKLNKEDPHAQRAAELLNSAINSVCEAWKALSKAADEITDTTEADKIVSLQMIAEDLECEIRKIARCFE